MENTMIITCILSSTLAATIITSLKEIYLWRLNRRAKLNDKRDMDNDSIKDIETKLEETSTKILEIFRLLEDLNVKVSTNIESDRLILQDRIKFIAMRHIRDSKISYEDRKVLHKMWKLYHYKLGGNGDLDSIMNQIDQLDLDIEGKNY